LALVLLAGLPGAVTRAEEAPGDAQVLDSARSTLAKWMETQQIISKERRDWQVGKEVLQERIALMENEIATLEERIAKARAGISEADGKRQEVVGENDALKAATASLTDVIVVLETKTGRLLKMLPGLIRQRVDPLSQRLPADPATTSLSLSERYQNVIGILNEVNKANQDITVTSELRVLPGGATAEVKALYVGLGQGYYVTSSGDAAGVGRPTAEGWEWAPANELAAEISRAIAILQNEDVPAYVPLPVEIQ
jgi:chromosome segregation ATPase